MLYLDICGGLGDGFISMHEFDSYEKLAMLGPGERATVTINSHNPFVDEVFRWHPKLAQLTILKSSHFFHEYLDNGRRAAAGLPPHHCVAPGRRDRMPVRFYPSGEDLKVLGGLPKRPYLAIAPSSSGMEIENRNIPFDVVSQFCIKAKSRGIPVVFLGRTYQGPHAPKEPPKRPSGDGVFDLTDRLSVPGTAEAVRRSRAIVTAHSALLLLSWYERKPTFVLYPPKYKHHDFDNPSPFGFGKDYPETTRMLFAEFAPPRCDDFLAKYFRSGRVS